MSAAEDYPAMRALAEGLGISYGGGPSEEAADALAEIDALRAEVDRLHASEADPPNPGRVTRY